VSADLIGVVRLVHRLTGFLVRLTPRQLTELAEGRLTLTVGDPADQPTEFASLPAQPDKPARGQAERPSRGRPVADDPADVDYAEIAAMLRKQNTVNDGYTYLAGLRMRGKKPLKRDLVAIAKELNLTLPGAITVVEATNKLVNHAIGNRRKYDGLRP
jgi:hypothetical protein